MADQLGHLALLASFVAECGHDYLVLLLSATWLIIQHMHQLCLLDLDAEFEGCPFAKPI